MLDVDAFLQQFLNINRVFVEAAKSIGRNNAGDHDRQNDGVIVGQLKQHQNISQRSLHDCPCYGTHPYQRIGFGRGGKTRIDRMHQSSIGRTQHGTNKQGRSEHSTQPS